MIKANKKQLTEVKNVLADGGYRGEEFASQVSENIAGREVEMLKRSQLHSLK